jgi:hypothetical protein
MKTFTIVLPVVTVSTILAVFILTVPLKNVQKVISRNIPKPGQKLHDFMLEHRRKNWGKEQSRATRAPEEQHTVWKYLAFFLELCFIRLPVHEVKDALDLYGLCKRPPASTNSFSTISQKHLRSNTTLASEYRPDTGEMNAKSRVQKVRELEELRLAEEKSARGGLIFDIVKQAPTILFIAVRILLLCLWIPLLLLEYLVLLFCCPFIGGLTEPTQLDSSQLRINRREQVKRFFIGPILFVGFDISQFYTWRSRGQHEHRSPLPPAGPYDLALASVSQSYLYPDKIGGNRLPALGRKQGVHGAERIRHAMAQPDFQQQYFSGSSPTPVPAQQNAHFRSHGYSTSQDGIPRRVGSIWMDSGQESPRV